MFKQSSFSITLTSASPLPQNPPSAALVANVGTEGEREFQFPSSGFDITDTFSRLVNRPNPTVSIGPVDFSCAFLVADALKPDITIVYVSPAFCKLTGYDSRECIGRNCRFLQWPHGSIDRGTDEANALNLNRIRAALSTESEWQVTLINYRKNGERFHNLITCIPVRGDMQEVRYWVGFQADIHRQVSAPSSGVSQIRTPSDNPISPRLKEIMGLPDDVQDQRRYMNNLLAEQSDDFLIVLSLDGTIEYASSRVGLALGYKPEELISAKLYHFIHNSDIATLMKEIRSVTMLPNLSQSATAAEIAAFYQLRNQLVHLMYRAHRKPTGLSSHQAQYVWLESTGRVHVNHADEMFILLATRVLSIPRLSWSQIEFAGGMGDPDCWVHVSLEGGLILGVACGARKVLESATNRVMGTRLQDWIREQSHRALEEALGGMGVMARESSPTEMRPIQLTCMRAAISDDPRVVVITLYPPNFSTTDSSHPAEGPSPNPPPSSLGPTSSIICRIRFPILAPPKVEGGVTTRDYLIPFFYDILPQQTKAPSQWYAERQNIHLADVQRLGDVDLFHEFNAGPHTNERWDEEIQQLKAHNKMMRKEIEKLAAGQEAETSGGYMPNTNASGSTSF